MNFYDVYTTLSRNPETSSSLDKISDYLKCPNTLETLKQALFKKPSRSQYGGAFPFDEETGKIYDTLWKAADAENYSAATRFGRWLMKTICPPADDEGMNAFYLRGDASDNVVVTHEASRDDDDYIVNDEVNEQPNEKEDNEDDIIVVEEKPKQKADTIVQRKTNKKDD